MSIINSHNPTNFTILKADLDSFNYNISDITNYFLEIVGFEGVVIYKDKPNAYFDFHFHPDDEYLYMLEGSMTVDINKTKIELNKSHFLFFEGKNPHSAKIGINGAKYIVASPKADFSCVYIATN